jgi:hypothetical protein
MLAGAAVAAGGNAASAVISQIIIRIFTGTFNPAYKKVDKRRMRYIQKKFALAYQSGSSSDDSAAVIASIGTLTPYCYFMLMYSNLLRHTIRPQQQIAFGAGWLPTS